MQGNPACVCVLPRFPATATMQALAGELGLVTAFLVRETTGPALRWFTPSVEEAMCGHATLAAGWLMLRVLEPGLSGVVFQTPAGPLTVRAIEDQYEIDLPARAITPCAAPDDLARALGATPTAVLRGASYIAVFDDAAIVSGLDPDMAGLARLDLPGVIVTAPGAGEDCDFVSRYFAPAKGLPEDPATGSAHAQLVPYWAARLGRPDLRARQLSRRGARIACRLNNDRVVLRAGVVPIMEGTITADLGDI